MQKASLVKGTRDFGPIQVAKKNYIFDTIKKVFKSYGFAPLETPSMEKIETLTGKYGEEGDQLLFRILNNGDILPKAESNFDSNRALKSAISDKGLRYDLTVPFARYTAMNMHALKMPFKRYQIQPVWRADRPQKGRYREFWQCDADTIGTRSLICELECIEMFDKVFSALNLPVVIHLNHRKLLEAIAIHLGFEGEFEAFTVAIDKMDKIGFDGVVKELESKNLDTSKFENAQSLLTTFDFESKQLKDLDETLKSVLATQAIKDLSEIRGYYNQLDNDIVLDTSLARGLSYYTGCIFEVKLKEGGFGSVAAGGRYDDLTEVFGVKDISGIGISFGADRMYDVLEDLNLFPQEMSKMTDVLICPMDKDVFSFALQTARKIRNNTQQSCLVYPKEGKLKKQLDYANALNAQYAIIIGSEEVEKNEVSIKNLNSGEQKNMDLTQLIELLK